MDINLERKELEKIYGKISPFEFKNQLIDLAETSQKKSTRALLDAGRGNPNWIASTPRDAFFTFGHFATQEAKQSWCHEDLAGIPQKYGIANRFFEYIEKNHNYPGTKLLKDIVNYGINDKKFNPDEWVFELVNGIIGCDYPLPERMLSKIEVVVHDYLIQELCSNNEPDGKFNIFAVEGATSAMCYLFNSLSANKLLHKGDKIALMTPIFTPYLEIPILPNYDLEIVPIIANELTPEGAHTWQYPKSELEKLKDPSVKALFIVNPSNPASIALSPKCTEELVNIIKNYNKDIMIISDDVYGTFVDGFQSLMSKLPYNTIGVYSYSKYFGVTGWRLGTMAIHENNVFDNLLKKLPFYEKKELHRRYEGLSTTPEDIKFIDRLVADSRQVALNHTAGLSTPQQVQMAFFSIFSILDKNNNYKKLTMEICHVRKKLLFQSLGLPLKMNKLDACYYCEFDLLEWANLNYGNEFSNYLKSNFKTVDVLFRLAKESSIVLLSGGGFSAPEWSIRISLANLKDEAYIEIGIALKKILNDFVSEWKKTT